MILSGVGIDLPLSYNRNQVNTIMENKGISRYEAEKEWKKINSDFGFETDSLCAKVARMLPKIRTEKFWKLLAECSQDMPENEKVSVYAGAACVPLKFDFEKYKESDEQTKIAMQIEILRRAAVKAVKAGIEEVEPIISICDELSMEPFENTWIWKRKRLPNKLTVSILMEHELKAMNIFALFEDRKSGKRYKKLLLTELPSPFCYKIRLGHIEVEGDNGILLYDQFGKVVAKAEATPDMLK